MLATFVIEFCLAFYTIWRYKMTSVSRIATAILISLGVFQFTEYMVCGGLGLTHIGWARIGYVAITLLPALGIHMLTAIANKKSLTLVVGAYTTCAVFVAYYLVNATSVTGPTCMANYAVFNAPYISSRLFGLYYYGWLMIGTFLALQWSRDVPKRRTALQGMMIGYLTFLVPTTTFNIIDPSTLSGIPSIMCGFAVLLAFVLVMSVLPNSCAVTKETNSILEKLPIRFN